METDYFDHLRALSQPIRAADLPRSIDHVRHLLDALGSPQTGYRSVVVTGSTGKGTTCLQIAHALRASGQKVGLYTSPHLHSFRERFAILDTNSVATPRIITQPEFVAAAKTVLAAQAALDHPYSTFESATALALCWFADQKIDVAVLEIGIGGRFDAVNAVANDLAVFTPIEAEHVAMLGGSLASVAWHKAGIIQPGGFALTVPQVPAVMAVLEQEALQIGASLRLVARPANALPASLLGRGGVLPDAQPLALPGRLERVIVAGRPVIIDGGHTPNAARHLREFTGEAKSIRLIAGMLRDKNVVAYLSVFDAPSVHFVYTRAPGGRALTPDELLERYTPTQASVTLAPSLDEALQSVETANEDLIVVAGSLRVAAAAREAFGLLSPVDLDEARRTRAIFEGTEYQKKLK